VELELTPALSLKSELMRKLQGVKIINLDTLILVPLAWTSPFWIKRNLTPLDNKKHLLHNT